MKEILIASIPTLGTIIVTLITFFTNRNVNKIKAIKEEILVEVKENRDKYEKQMSEHILDNEKTYLTDFLSDLEAGEPKSQIQMYRAYDIKKDYNKRGGDSYVDDKWDELVTKGLLKK